MKLTKDMFDFEKYEYFTNWAPGSHYLHNAKTMLWGPPIDAHPDGLYRRKNPPPPRYILLNEGEKLEDGDEYYAGYPNRWTQAVIKGRIPETVLPGEIIRRKVQE